MKIPSALAILLIPAWGWSQAPLPVPPAPAADFSSNRPSDGPTSMDGKEYRLGQDDLVEVAVFEIPELSGSSRLTAAGEVVLPYVGAVSAAGKTPQELGRSIEGALRQKYVNDPHVTVFIREYASQPVSVIGAVRAPGIYQIKGQKLLLDVLAMAQGLSEGAGKTIQIIRRPLAAPDAPSEGAAPVETFAIDAPDLFQNGNATLNIPIVAGDVINVLNAGSIFAVGELQRPGEYTLRYGRDVSVTQAVALGGGTTQDAKKNQAFIIRPHTDGSKEQIEIDLTKILSGSDVDIRLLPNDVLFVPASRAKAGIRRALDSAVSIVIGRAVYLGR